MTVAVITLALAVLALGLGLVVSLTWGRGALNAQVKAEKEALATERKCLDLEDDRDAERARATKAETERDAAEKASAIHEAAARAAREELHKYVAEKLATGSDDDVAAEVDRLLGVAMSKAKVDPVSSVPRSPASNDRG